MKRLIIIAIALTALFSAGLFAADPAGDYVVQTVTGKVEREVSAGKWEAVEVGMKLAPSTVVNTGLNSSLVLKAGDKVIVIKAMQKGTVEKLVAAMGVQTSGIKLGAKVNETAVTADSGQARSNVSTASTRASEATEDLEWVDSE